MNYNFYIPRKLSSSDKKYTEVELLASSNYIVVLAEPGAGKTELMNSLARQLEVSAMTANFFNNVGSDVTNSPLVIDAFDELAKIDQTGIYRLLANARKASPSCVIISSRSSEWDNAATHAFSEFFGHQPLIVRLYDFDKEEQKTIFDHHIQGEDFTSFQEEVARFDLEMLLPNPQFLKLFADAYIESERHFLNKRSIFSLAIERLAKEANTNISKVNTTLSIDQKINISSEIFAKLLLSGAEGVSANEANENRIYPLLASLFSKETMTNGILATRLFKLGDSVDQHRPVHKIVAEYCAANYLTKRITDPADSLTFCKCLPTIAPNSVVRDELRGMLGWMASLGGMSIQEAAIKLDPYAVLANGDPSQLANSSKRLLIHRLKEVETMDPYFRRGDFQRRFSVAGFFTHDVVEEIKPLLKVENNGHLRNLILELLAGSPIIEQLRYELSQLFLTSTENKNARYLASRLMFDIPNYDHHDDFEMLVSEANHTSLELAAEIIQALGVRAFDLNVLENYFRVCANLYPGHNDEDRVVGSRYFIKKSIYALDNLTTIEFILDGLAKDFSCKCGKERYECDCRNGISKIIGSILDRYFDLAKEPFDPKQIWQWIENLNFHGQKSPDQSKAVRVLQENDALRQGIIANVFKGLTDQEQIFQLKHYKFDWNTHSGLHFTIKDYKFIVDLAFETNNPQLWAYFMFTHQPYRNKEERNTDGLRQHMRKQALEKAPFMREWIKVNRDRAKFIREHKLPSSKYSRRRNRRLRNQEHTRLKNIKYIQENRGLIESGRHWNALVRFADITLRSPEKILQEVGDETIVRNALRNCIDFISPHVPELHKLSELRQPSQTLSVELILYAACLEIIRAAGSLEGIDLRILNVLRTTIHAGHPAVSDEEQNVLKSEVDRLIFYNFSSAENFIRQYVEPQLTQKQCIHPDIWLLRNEEAFRHLRGKLSMEWICHFHDLSIYTLDTLFEISAKYGNLDDLKKIIAGHCEYLMSNYPQKTDDEDIEIKREFWLIRAFYFLNDVPKIYWDWLIADKNTVLILYERSSKLNRHDHPYWPKLTSCKIEAILDAFIDQWPKVDLPSNWGTGSPKGENAYRFLTEVIWSIDSNDPEDAIPVLNRLISSPRFADLRNDLKSIYAGQIRKKALRDFEPPKPQAIVDRLDRDAVVTVGDMRQLILQELEEFQNVINGGEFNTANLFYANGVRLGEIRCTEIIAERLHVRLEPQGISVTPEHQLKSANRCDFTATKIIDGKRRLLVTEVKGQWHAEIYTAASAQLHERYSIHPDAENQGIFLAIWFGTNVKVAGRKRHGIKSAQELKDSIEAKLPPELLGQIDVFILDVFKPQLAS